MLYSSYASFHPWSICQYSLTPSKNPQTVPLFDTFHRSWNFVMQPPPNQLPDSPSAAHLPSFFASLNKTRSSQFRELLQTPPESSHTSQHGRSSKEEASYSFSHNKVPHPHIGLSTSKWPSRNSSQCDTLQPLLAQELFVHNKGRKITTASDRIMEAIEGALIPCWLTWGGMIEQTKQNLRPQRPGGFCPTWCCHVEKW